MADIAAWLAGDEKLVDMCGADKIKQGYPVDCVGRITHLAPAVTNVEFWMVILLFSDPGNCVDECHGLGKVLKFKASL